MALTPQNNEAFLREVDEELRRDEAVALWQRYGRAAIVAVVIALAAFGGYLFWQHQRSGAAEKEGEQLQSAYDDLAANDRDAAMKKLGPLEVSSHPGYRVLARFTRADMLLQQNNYKAAAKLFADIAGDGSVAQPFRDLALIRQTSAEFDVLAPQVVAQRMAPLAVAGNPWFGSAGELLAMAQLRQGRRDLAGQTFARIAADDTVPRTIRQRAVQMAGASGGATATTGNKAAE